MGATIALSECAVLYLRKSQEMFSAQCSTAESWLIATTQKLNLPLLLVATGSDDALNLSNCIAKLKLEDIGLRRMRLLIAGEYLEFGVTVVGLNALAEGYDVHLLADLISVSDRKNRTVHWQRLVQAGAVPTTMAQVLFEWGMTEKDLVIIKDVEFAAAQFRSLWLQS